MFPSLEMLRRLFVGLIGGFAVAAFLGGSAVAQDKETPAGPSATETPATDTETPTTEGGQQEQLDAKAILEEGNKALEDKDYEKALAAFDKLARGLERAQSVEAYQALPLAYTGRARALAGLKEYEAAIEDFKKV